MVLRVGAARGRVALAYLAIRARMPARYRASALDDLLRALDEAPRLERVALRDVAPAIVVAEKIARRTMRPDTCLFRALSRYAVLRATGHAPRFVMGIDEHDPADGHAWISIDERPFLERHSARMRTTFEHPSRA